MTKQLLYFCLFLFSCMHELRAQPGTMIVYETATQSTLMLLPASYDTSITSEHTGNSLGSMGNQVTVSLVPPTGNLFPGASFCEIIRAADVFDLSTYPARTAVALRYYDTSSVYTGCSGILVSRNFVLTAAHCVYLPSAGFTMADSVKAVPAFNNGVAHPAMPVSLVKKAYLFKSYYDGTDWEDIALLELKDPIGIQTGWVGIGFDDTFANYQNKVFHKFSYPGKPHPIDSTRVYNGDTLYYNYGYISDYASFLGVTGATGIQGQSGSPLVYTDNSMYYAAGVLNFSTNYLHRRINTTSYFQFKNIMESSTVGLEEREALRSRIQVYPNPFRDRLVLEYEGTTDVELNVYTLLGQPVRELKTLVPGRLEIDTRSFEKGMYFMTVKIGNERFSVGKFFKD